MSTSTLGLPTFGPDPRFKEICNLFIVSGSWIEHMVSMTVGHHVCPLAREALHRSVSSWEISNNILLSIQHNTVFLNYHRICDCDSSAAILYCIETTKQNICMHVCMIDNYYLFVCLHVCMFVFVFVCLSVGV